MVVPLAATPPKPAFRALYAGLALVVLGAVLLRLPFLRRGFFADDYFFLERVRGKSLLEALVSPDPLGNFLRPVSRQLYFWAIGSASGESPLAFHAVNLLLFVCSLVLLFRIARRLADERLALIATAFAGFHYAADVPLLWVSGSQELLAVTFALLALDLHLARRMVPAAIALMLALLSKESVALTPVVALLMSWRESGNLREAARRSAALFAVTAAWAIAWLLTLGLRPAAGTALSIGPEALPAALVHLLQVAAGLEFRLGAPPLGHWSLAALATGVLAGALIWLITPGGHAAPAKPPAKPRAAPAGRRPALAWIGAAWAVCGALPVMVVAPIWSAYFYLFALCGVAILLAALLQPFPRAVRAAALGALVLLSANASALEEFSRWRNAWSWQSHVNRHYLSRAMGTIERYLTAMRSARPSLPPNSTVYFGNLPPSLGFQAGDGPLVRWAYRDSSLRSHFVTDFAPAGAARGPMFFFVVVGGSLVDRTNDPLILPSFAYSMLLSDRPAGAADVIDLALARGSASKSLRYWRAWARWASGDTAGAKEDLSAMGMGLGRSVSPAVRGEFAPGVFDTSMAIRRLLDALGSAALDPWVHARLAALCLSSPAWLKTGVIEAFAFHALDPADPDAWRKWAAAQIAEGKYDAAVVSLEAYIRLGGQNAMADREAARALETLRKAVTGRLPQSEVQR